MMDREKSEGSEPREPLVSVYIPTFNRAHLLKRAVDSILSQSYKNIEIVVCSDNSSDETDLIMKEYCQRFSNIVFLTNEKNEGACFSRNRAVEVAQGEFVTGLDDDDFFLEDRIEAFVSSLDEFGEDVIFYTGRLVKRRYGVMRRHRIKVLQPVYGHLLRENVIGSQVFMKRELFILNGGFDKELPALQDYEFWLRLASRGYSFRGIDNTSYTVDTSHPWERITKGLVKVRRAFEIVERRHKDILEVDGGDALWKLKFFYGLNVDAKNFFAVFSRSSFADRLRLLLRIHFIWRN